MTLETVLIYFFLVFIDLLLHGLVDDGVLWHFFRVIESLLLSQVVAGFG